MNKKNLFLVLIVFSFFFVACDQTKPKLVAEVIEVIKPSNDLSSFSTVKAQNNFPEWAKNATIYEVNLRQFTPEGTINAFSSHLPRIKEQGIDILWFMPVFPISEVKKKGNLGSPYAVADYRAINPEFGTIKDFKRMLKKAHAMGLRVILDWVPNHSGWDHPWIESHPEYYTQVGGIIVDPINPETGESWGWTDVADFNYNNKDLQKAMISEMEYWVKEIGIDGFRCDVAHNVPNGFWDQATEILFKNGPLFLLAESEVPYHVNSGDFTTTYAWKFNELMNAIAKEEANAGDIDEYLKNDRLEFKNGFHMYFTTNHDENSWQGTVFERLHDGHKAFAVLASTLDGMPLLYGGQEAPIKKRLAFFERDPIEWNNYEYADFYKTLFKLKHINQALWNGKYGGGILRIPTGKDAKVFAFTREKNGDRVVVILNLSNKSQDIKISSEECVGKYTNVFAKSTISIEKDTEMTLDAWDYLVLSNR